MSTENEMDVKSEDEGTKEKDSEEIEESSTSVVEEEKVNLKQMQQLEEAKMKSKYPTAIKPGGFLQKRLNKGKYFDSGDYNMAKAKASKRTLPTVTPQPMPQPTGEAIPTPDNLPTRKVSLVQSKLAAGLT